MVANILHADPAPSFHEPRGLEQYIAYQIKGNHENSNMVANIKYFTCRLHPLGLWSKGQNSTL